MQLPWEPMLNMFCQHVKGWQRTSWEKQVNSLEAQFFVSWCAHHHMAEWEVGGWWAEGDTVELVAPVEDVQQIYDVAREGYQCETFPVTSITSNDDFAFSGRRPLNSPNTLKPHQRLQSLTFSSTINVDMNINDSIWKILKINSLAGGALFLLVVVYRKNTVIHWRWHSKQ